MDPRTLGWIAERLLNLHNSVDIVVDAIAHQAAWIAGLLFVVSLLSWCVTGYRGRPSNNPRAEKTWLGRWLHTVPLRLQFHVERKAVEDMARELPAHRFRRRLMVEQTVLPSARAEKHG